MQNTLAEASHAPETNTECKSGCNANDITSPVWSVKVTTCCPISISHNALYKYILLAKSIFLFLLFHFDLHITCTCIQDKPNVNVLQVEISLHVEYCTFLHLDGMYWYMYNAKQTNMHMCTCTFNIIHLLRCINIAKFLPLGKKSYQKSECKMNHIEIV